MSLTKEERDDLKGLLAEFVGSGAIAEAVDQAVAKHAERRPEAQRKIAEGQAVVRAVTEAVREDGADQLKAAGIQVKDREPGLATARYMRAIAATKLAQSRGALRSPVDFLTSWGDKDLAQAWEKAMAASTAADGGFIVPAQFSTDVTALLRAAAVIRRLGAVVIPMPNGNLRLPKVTAGMLASYIGENANITTSQLTLGQNVLTFKKLAGLVPVSNDLVRYSSPGADAIVRDDGVAAMATRETQAFIRDTGTDSTPKGLRYWANATTASAGTSLANMTTDLGVAVLALANANIPEGRWAWIMSPRNWNSLMTIQNTNGFFVFRDEMSRGTLWGFPFARTTAVPGSGATGELYLVNMADAVIGEGLNLVVDTSMEASYVDASSGSTVSAYQQDQTLIRMIQEHDFVLRRAESAHVITTMSW